MKSSKEENIKSALSVTATVAKIAFGATLPGTVFELTKKIKNSNGETIEVDKDKTDYQKDLDKVEFLSEVTKKKAQVAQELAIASRITTAETVEIEEFFDKKGEGKAGITYEKGVDVGANAQSVSKRIYRFKGFNDNVEGLSELLKSIIPTNGSDNE